MFVSAVIIEQLELDGLRSVCMRPHNEERIAIALLEEYDNPALGPFHYLDPQDERRFKEKYDCAPLRRLGSSRLRRLGSGWEFNTQWTEIPTTRGDLTYYSILLPEYGIPTAVRFLDPHSRKEYRKRVVRDDARRRFVLYLECRSSRGNFDFKLQVMFWVSRDSFYGSEYRDQYTYGDPATQDLEILDLPVDAGKVVKKMLPV